MFRLVSRVAKFCLDPGSENTGTSSGECGVVMENNWEKMGGYWQITFLSITTQPLHCQ